ncbi:PREDICTED: uncharacterized protein LOC108364750 [Rhagoletis zephyria]|uniref:uncharacterized protein LOC108364750 n=1 Tax=Rhagoletis zephyria TaxID=28612 RepID=UPI0008112083|nr:PREDICTED: uncharacterized protein LOC108364750 [Rhagoletis zephyria]
MSDSKIRVRLPNYTPAEEHFLLTLVKQKSNVVESNLSDSFTWVTKRKAWDEIDLEFTRKFGLRRGAKNLREKYVVLKRDQKQLERKKHLDRVAEILGLATDSKTSADSNAINTYGTETEAAKNGIIEDERLQDTESRDTEHPNQWFYSSSEKSIPNENVISYSPSYFRTNKESSTNTERLFWENEELRAAEKHRWDAERHKHDVERHQWELEKHKWKLKEHKLKEQILEQELKSMSLRASSRTTAGDTITPAEKDDLPKNLQPSQEDVEKTDSSLLLLRSPSTLLPQIKKEPTLEITDIPATTFNEIRTLTNATNMRKRLGSVSADEHCAIKKLKSTQQVTSEEHIQLEERVLNNDTLDMNSTDGSYYDLSHLVNGEFDSDIGHNEDEDGDDEAYHALNVETGKAQDENEFLQLLTKYKLRHHFFKLEELNIGLDCLKSISDMDIKDIFGFDIGARIRFRGLVEEWRAANTNSNTTSGCQMGLDETVTKRDIADSKN